MDNHYYAVIMAGGGGTRLWPLSRRSRPKQMLSLFDERTLFQTAVQRLDGIFPPERIFVVTVADQAGELQKGSPEIPAENYLIEPMPRGTASVVGLAAVALRNLDPQAVMAVLTADHYIGNEERFHRLLEAALEVARDGYLVTLGIEPTFASTGFGYIQQGERMGVYQGLEAFRVARFKEKPSADQAQSMLADGEHSWNSGMFVWRVDRILAEFERQMPELAGYLTQIESACGTPEQETVLQQIWPRLKPETIDYGIMEGAENVAVIPASRLEWSDVGSWDSLFDVLEGDEAGNIARGVSYLGLDTGGSLIFGDGAPHRLVVTIGVDDLVVVDTGDVLLVCRKDQAQRVREVVHHLRENGKNFI